MDQILNYVKPELLIVAVVLYFIGAGLKKAQTFKDKYIPLILGVIGIVLCAIWVLGTCPTEDKQDIAMVAGLSTYVDQVVKQVGKRE